MRLRVALAERVASLLVLLVAWEAASRWAHSRLFPGPEAVLATLADEAAHGGLVHDLGATLARVAVAFTLAMVIGTVLGIAMARSRAIDTLLDSGVVLLLNLPALVIARVPALDTTALHVAAIVSRLRQADAAGRSV